MIEVISKSKIKTEKIFFKLHDEDSTKRMVESFNYVPYVYIKKIDDPIYTPPIDGTAVDPRDIIYVKLFNNKFLPEIELSCEDSKGILFNNLYPFDHDTLICIFVKSNTEKSFPIRMDFRVTEYETIKTGQNLRPKYLIKGILNVDELHYVKYEAYDDTSFNVLKNIATNFNLGFATNVNSSDDKMKWINPQATYLDFIKDVSKHAYISDDTFIWTFIDFYYNLNYVDIQKEMNNFTYTRDDEKSYVDDVKMSKEELESVKQYLTSNKAFAMTNKYIAKFNILNRSFINNLEKNYNNSVVWYNQNEVTVYNEKLKTIKNDNPSDGQLMQLVDENSDISKNNFEHKYNGKLDTDNCHKKYLYAKILNENNIINVNKLKMVVSLNQINFDIKRFQNIIVEIYNDDDMLSREANEESDKGKPLQNINNRLSGYWYVTGINYIYKRTGGPEQEITLMRRDLSKDYEGLIKDLRKDTK